MKLLDYHDAFLRNTVDLNQTRLDLLASRVDSIYAALGMDDTFGPLIEDLIPQGSWAHRTIIRPIGNREFDADVLVLLKEQPDWNADPRRYLNELKAALDRSSYKDMNERHTRCVRVIYMDDCHVDVVPHLSLEDGRQVIVNWSVNAFEDSNPDGFTDWMKDKDELASRKLRKVIRLLKYLRDDKGTFSIPSVILTILVGERVSDLAGTDLYSDVPTALKNLTADLDSWLQMYPNVPTIEDPSCPGVNFNHRWDQDRYAVFRRKVHDYAGWIADAYDEPDRNASLAKWQRVFGEDFKAPAQPSAAPAAKSAPITEAAAPKEQFIEDRFPIQLRYWATISGRVRRLPGFRNGPIRGLGPLDKGRYLDFVVRTETPAPYEVYWKVRNHGTEAEASGDLRGEITHDGPAKIEHTKYGGVHSVECYIVKDGRVVATDHHRVEIR